MTDTDIDAPLETLLATLQSQQSEVSVALLKEIYDLERRFQFERDRSKVMAAIRRAVEAQVTSEDAERDEGK